MGQYRQWLQHRDADQQLRAQQKQLETEMMRLQEQARIVADVSSLLDLGDNPIILALIASLDTLAFPNTPSSPNGSLPITKQDPMEQSTTSLIAPIQHTKKPHLDPMEGEHVAKDTLQPTSPTQQEAASDSVPHPEIALLPQDMTTSFDEHTQTEPQLELPWWLRNLIENSLSGQGTRPIDQESLRANRLVQRWSERWGLQPSQSPAQPTIDHIHDQQNKQIDGEKEP